ncbi:unnamed protein product, partial [Natator depressus]
MAESKGREIRESLETPTAMAASPSDLDMREETTCPICLEYLTDPKQTQTERQKIVSEFQQLQQFLEEQERLLLAQLEKPDKEILRIQKENVTKLSKEISRLSELISELEGKRQKPASEFLQDVRSTLS